MMIIGCDFHARFQQIALPDPTIHAGRFHGPGMDRKRGQVKNNSLFVKMKLVSSS
jgi:hypothetical protein